MHLVSALMAGMRGAENGSVRLRQRGTSTPATYYTTFEGDGGAIVANADIPLDLSGRAVVFVDSLVDCTVYAFGGAELVHFVAGDAGSAVEVRSQSFTGTDYISGASGPSKPTTLAAVLDLWKTNAGGNTSGGIDWKVLFGGTTKTLFQILGGLSGLFFNVKDPAYGAKGDGVTDDRSAIGAATTAAGVFGGVVYFPPGTYRISGDIEPLANVSFLGCGPAASFIKVDSVDNPVFYFTNAQSVEWQFIRGLRLGAAQVNTAVLGLVGTTGGVKLHIEDCQIGDANTKTCITTAGNGERLVCVATTFIVGNAASKWLSGTSTPFFTALGCRFVAPAAVWVGTGIDTTGAVALFACEFVLAPAQNGSAFTCIRPGQAGGAAGGGGPPTVIACCDFQSTGAGVTVTAITGAASMTNMCDLGNAFAQSLATPYGTMGGANDVNTDGNPLLSRSTREEMQTTDGNPTVKAGQYGLSKIVRGAGFAGATTLTVSAPKSPGHDFTLVYHNPNGGGATGLVTVVGVKGLATFTVNASSCSAFFLRSVEENTTLVWVLIATQANFAP